MQRRQSSAPRTAMHRLRRPFQHSCLSQVSKDGTIKRAYRLHDGQVIESVLMPYADGRRTACISSQVTHPLQTPQPLEAWHRQPWRLRREARLRPVPDAATAGRVRDGLHLLRHGPDGVLAATDGDGDPGAGASAHR